MGEAGNTISGSRFIGRVIVCVYVLDWKVFRPKWRLYGGEIFFNKMEKISEEYSGCWRVL